MRIPLQVIICTALAVSIAVPVLCPAVEVSDASSSSGVSMAADITVGGAVDIAADGAVDGAVDGEDNDDPQTYLRNLIAKLDDDEFLSRLKARQRLADHAMNFGIDDLKQGLHHESIEVRLATQAIIREAEQARQDEQLLQFINPRVPVAQLATPGWNQFASCAGTDLHARRSYAAILKKYPFLFRAMPLGTSDNETTLDPYRLGVEDQDRWIILLTEQIIANRMPESNSRVVAQSKRIATALTNTALGPDTSLAKSTHQSSAIVIQRLIGVWLNESKPAQHCDRTRLLVATRYHCDNEAGEIASSVLADPSSSPSAVVTAMLVASKLNRSDFHFDFSSFTADTRTAHVWQMIADRKVKIRTQVRDVAMALRLHHHHFDPRQFGFEHLEADPLVGFRDYSLGFTDDVSRHAAHQRAAEALIHPSMDD
ncbi:hypothetical protein [Rubripirellula amarantea]|nr:hypothetical protein [Rubripirellula amarantea]